MWTWRAGSYPSTTCPRSSPAAAAKDCGWAPMPLMRSWTPAWKRQDRSLRPVTCVCNSQADGWPRSTSAKARRTPAASTTRPPRLPSRARTGCRKSGHSNGWDGRVRVTRVEFRYKRECLREMKVEEAYAFLDQIPGLWAYSTKQWLRHTIPNGDPNRARWPLSSLWQLVQQASFFCDGTPAVRERRRAGDLTLLCQMIAGCSTSAAAFLTQVLPAQRRWDALSHLVLGLVRTLPHRERRLLRPGTEAQRRLGWGSVFPIMLPSKGVS